MPQGCSKVNFLSLPLLTNKINKNKKSAILKISTLASIFVPNDGRRMWDWRKVFMDFKVDERWCCYQCQPKQSSICKVDPLRCKIPPCQTNVFLHSLLCLPLVFSVLYIHSSHSPTSNKNTVMGSAERFSFFFFLALRSWVFSGYYLYLACFHYVLCSENFSLLWRHSYQVNFFVGYFLY